MAILSCHRARDNDGTSKGDHMFKRSHTLSWIVVTDSVAYTGFQILVDGVFATPHPLPYVYDAHPHDIHSWAKDATATRSSEDPKVWMVSVNYDNNTPDRNQNNPNPLARPVKYKVEFSNFTTVVTDDINGNAIVNGAGEEFDPPIEVDDSRPILVATKNLGTLQQVVSLARNFKNAINTNTFHGAPPFHAKVLSITAGDEQIESNHRYYPTTFRVEVSDKTWRKRILNQGMRHFITDPVTGNKKLVPATVADGINKGMPLNAPVNLLGGAPQGGAQDPAAQKGFRAADTADPRFLEFKVYPEKDFSGLGI